MWIKKPTKCGSYLARCGETPEPYPITIYRESFLANFVLYVEDPDIGMVNLDHYIFNLDNVEFKKL